MRYEQPEMEILLFGAKVDTIVVSDTHGEGTGSSDGGSTGYEGGWTPAN